MRRLFLLGTVLATAVSPALAQQNGATEITAVRAEMLQTVQSAQLKVGDTFLLKTVANWQQNHCTIRQGTLVTAEVSTLQAQPVVLGLRFAPLPCAESEKGEVRPVLIALQAEHTVPNSALNRLDTAGAEASTIGSLFTPERANVPTSGDPMLTSSHALSTTSYAGLKAAPAEPLRTGQVLGMRGVTMQLPDGSVETRLLSRSRTLSLQKYAELLLLLSPTPSARVALSLSSPNTENNAPPPSVSSTIAAVPEQPLNACASAQCVELPASSADGPQAATSWSVSLARYGLKPRLVRQVLNFEQSASILALGSDQLLVTFDLHTLIHRTDNLPGVTWHPKNVRAVLLSRSTGQVLAVRDWVVSDDLAPAVWGLGDGKVVAHVGADLVMYGSGFSELGRLHLAGPLLFLSSSTAGELLVVATVHERHTRADHEKLSAVLAPGETIAEDYDLTGLDGALHPTATRLINAQPVEPALIADAMFSTTRSHADFWKVDRSTWTGQNQTVATLRSGCELRLTPLAASLLLARGCPHNESVENWFDVLDPHGNIVIHGQTGVGDVLQQAQADRDGRVLAVATTHFDRVVRRGEKLNVRDFERLTLTLYSVHGGKPVFTAHLPHGSSQQQTFSLAPDGLSLAVMTGETVQVLRVPSQTSALAMP